MKKREFLALAAASTLLLATLCGCSTGDSGEAAKPQENEVEYKVIDQHFAPWSRGLEFTENINGTLSVSGIGNCRDSEIIIPLHGRDGRIVTGIADGAFKNCESIESVTLQDNVISIGAEAFSGCTSLEEINLPDTLDRVEERAFHDTAYYLNEENWEGRVLYIGKYLIKAKPLAGGEITVKDGTLLIADKAFLGNSFVKSLALPGSLTGIGERAFDSCRVLKKVNIPGSVKIIRRYAFNECEALVDLTFENGVQSIESHAFRYTAIQKVSLPESLKKINTYAFSECDSLDELEMPSGGVLISSDVFHRSKVWDDWYYRKADALYIGKHLIDVNQEISGSFEVREDTVSIAGYAFSHCENLTAVTIHDNVEIIGYNAFHNCPGLTEIYIGNGVKSIEIYAFWNCYNLKDIYYAGTKAEWAAIEKGENWDSSLKGYTVRCIDGDLYDTLGK
ncbi:MAG: leucine-rich repeat protein [Clostridia bacterium]|nr:leucine-rich repeat protein [Clostridia bacterium]